ncbi:MAG: sulfatase [Thermoanaerobaculia bacterium]|nr:sulfatase [Thermoanaerobaculia bacterium]
MPPRKRFPILLAILLPLAAAAAYLLLDPFRSARARKRAPRIVVVTLDTLNVRYAAPYNPEVATTPWLAGFAEEGVVFQRAYTAVPSTLPSHAGLFAGRDPAEMGIFVNGQVVPDEVETLAEMLGRRGYRTGAFVSLGVLRRRFGLAQGFQTYDDRRFRENRRWYLTADEVLAGAAEWVRENADDPFLLWFHLSDPHEPYQTVDAPPNARLTLDGETIGEWNVTDKRRRLTRIELPPGRHTLTWTSLRPPAEDDFPETAVTLRFHKPKELAQWIEDPAVDLREEVDLAEPFSVELVNRGARDETVFHIFSGKLTAPPPSAVLDAYPREVAYADHHLAELERLLRELGIGSDTLWVVVSDHGEGLFNHQILGHAVFAQEDQLRVAWMMKGPGVARGRVIDGAEALMEDVVPTLLDLLGLPEPSAVTGRSRAPCWRGGCEPRRLWWGFGASVESNQITALAGYRWPFKRLWQPEPGSGCFQIGEDPWEHENLCPGEVRSVRELPPELGRLERDLRDRLADLQARMDAAEGGAGERERDEILRALGYVGN